MKEKDCVKASFSKNKAGYISSTTHAKKNDLALLTEWLQPTSDMIAIDIATGGGHVAKQLAMHVKQVIATDITKEMLENTAKHLERIKNITYAIADAENLPFQDNSFDIITCRIAAHHFPNPKEFISEVTRVLKPKGKFLFIDNIASNDPSIDHFINTLEKMRDYSHVRSRTIAEWNNLLAANNLTIKKQLPRKKKLPYQEWVERTVQDKEHMDEIKLYILGASRDIQHYFQVDIDGYTIKSFSIDEWMVLCEKG